MGKKNKFDSLGTYTSNGVHLTTDGQKLVASLTLEWLQMPKVDLDKIDTLRKEVVRKNILWFHYWRPGNWAFLGGDRTTQAFSSDWKDKSKRIFPEEMKAFRPLMLEAEKRVEVEAAALFNAN
jgi:hypothetical protein